MNFFIFKNRMKGLIILILSSMHFMAAAQISVSLTEVNTALKSGQQCYEISLTNQGSKDISLAGQNYRLYYDSETVMLSESSVKTMLPTQYTSMNLVQHFFDVDASGFGVLPYDEHLGFINLATDLNLSTSGGLSIPAGKSISTASMCFDVVEGKTPVFTWAQDQLTHTYATAFVELALYDGNILKKASITEYRITQHASTHTQEANVFDLKYFPNPFTDKLNITFNESLTSDATYTIRDVFGNEIAKNKIAKGSTDCIIEGQNLPNGALLIEIKTNEGQISVMKAIKIE
jgi:hypothetical protein